MTGMDTVTFANRTDQLLLAACALCRAGLRPDSAVVPRRSRVEACLRMLRTSTPPRRAFAAPRLDRYRDRPGTSRNRQDLETPG
jgi:hypothetical protein